jgi:hypothetical protein
VLRIASGWTADDRWWHGKAVRLAVLMAVQPDSRPSARRRERNARLLFEVIERDDSDTRAALESSVSAPQYDASARPNSSKQPRQP